MLEPSWIGRRVTVRRVVGHTVGGRAQFGDVIGDLVGLDARTAVLDSRSGLVEVALESVTIAKPAPPSTADELALQAIAAAGWRAGETAQLGGWLLRATGGFTARANSVLPLRTPGMDLDEALRRAGEWYAERGLPLRLLVPMQARRLLDAELGERGWRTEGIVHTMAGRLDMLHAGPGDEHGVEIADVPDDRWLGRYRDGAGTTPIARRLLTRHDRAGFASIRDGEHVLAIGRGTVDDTWLGVTAVEVEPGHRRRGLARAVMAALWGWGSDRGATRSYLQVSVDNLPGVALDESLGYWVHHDYRYRLAPESGPLR
ncbi:MAG: GNAT family N-acetyltransferase [Actinomycetota bacterium]|nr:GNAT family N-acetyltransferase [Actinomycetota bacterium]